MILAPIVLFVYNRLSHTVKTVEALKQNHLAERSYLYIFSDAANDELNEDSVQSVRNYIRTISGFKKVTIVENDINFGLAKNIKIGINSICSKYKTVIVLEDDIVTSPYFLDFMNTSLNKYIDNDRVMQISGYNYPIDTTGINQTFFSSMAACWGWATWWRSWKLYSEDIPLLQESIYKLGKEKFIVSNKFSYWTQFELNRKGNLKTWFIFWYATIFINNGLCLYPKDTLVNNIGLDGTGTNSQSISVFHSPISKDRINFYEDRIEEFDTKNKKFRNYFNLTGNSYLFSRVVALAKKKLGIRIFKLLKKVYDSLR